MGCSKNLVDSESMMTKLTSKYEVCHDSNEEGFDIVIINTCGFISDAKVESIDLILQYAELKQEGEIEKLFVVGCLTELYKETIKDEVPEVDRCYGKFEFDDLAADLGCEDVDNGNMVRMTTTPDHYAYLKISEGCSQTCSFCIIPNITGRPKSRSIEDLVKEARGLVDNGVKELLIIAQDLSNYGKDIYGERRLAQLIEELSKIEKLEWIKLHYAYPTDFPYDILPLMKNNPKVCRYIDVALQHVSDNMLTKMRRKFSKKETYHLISRIREEVPGIAIRTTLLVGHPGETEEDFQELVEFVKETKFDRLGVFAYSHEEKSYAYNHYEDDVPEEVKEERVKTIMELQEQISLDNNHEFIGKELKVLVDDEEEEYIVARTEFDSPEVDQTVLIKKNGVKYSIGEFYKLKITDAADFDLFVE